MKQVIHLFPNKTDYAVSKKYDKLTKDYGYKANVCFACY